MDLILDSRQYFFFLSKPRICYSCPIMNRKPFLLLTAFVLLFASLPAAAQKFIPQSIQFKGAPEYSNQELLAAVGYKKDTPIAYSEVKSHSQRLLDTGLFEAASFTYNGVNLVFTLVPSTVLYSVRLQNLPLTPGKELDAALHDRVPLYHGKVPFDGGLTEQVRQALVAMLAAKGIQATVTAAPYTDQKLHEVSAMSYAITAPPVKLGEIHLKGVSPELQVKGELVASRAMKTDYDTENAAGNIERAFALFYSDEGYPAVKVHAEQMGNLVVSSEAIEIPFNVIVEEGRHYKLGSIHLPSGEPLTLAEINKTAGVVSNTVEKMSIAGGVTLRTALAFVTGQYKSKGYMDCVVTPRPQYDDANSIVNYTLEIQTGPVYTMGKLTIENGADDLRAVMLAAWKLPVGAVFSEKAIRDYYSSQSDKTALGRTFASVNCRYKLATNIQTHTVDVTLRLEKKQ
jgi:outer membrane protein assembly factor BamA